MKLIPQNLYHIYNRGNNRQTIFFNDDNYLFFIKKLRTHIIPYCDLLSYCLMPNHFHLMVKTPENFEEKKFYNNYKIMLSSYTRAINKSNNAVGSLFQQNSKTKNISEICQSVKTNSVNYPQVCFHYIHQNPIKAKLVSKMEDWQYSSFKDYAGLRKGTLCNQSLAKSLLDLPSDKNDFYSLSYRVINEDDFKVIL